MTELSRWAPLLRRLAIGATIVGGLVLSGGAVRDWIGFEPSAEWARAWVAGFGIWGPVVYTALLSVRHVFLLPSSLMLTLGGAAFGVVGGTLTGTVGLFVSGVLAFYLFRFVRPDVLVARMEARYASSAGRELIERGTPLAILLVTAVPPAPQTLLYFAVSLTRMRFATFSALILPSGAVRALVLSILGAGLLEKNPAMIAGSAGAIALGLGLCWIYPPVRAVLFPPPASPPLT